MIRITDASFKAVDIFLRFMAADYLEPSTDELTLVEVYPFRYDFEFDLNLILVLVSILVLILVVISFVVSL